MILQICYSYRPKCSLDREVLVYVLSHPCVSWNILKEQGCHLRLLENSKHLIQSNIAGSLSVAGLKLPEDVNG